MKCPKHPDYGRHGAAVPPANRHCRVCARIHTRYTDPRRHIAPQRLRDLLAKGYVIESRAFGRMGFVREVDPHDNTVYIASSLKARTRCVTCFHVGDAVRLKFMGAKRVLITHYMKDLNNLFKGVKKLCQI